MTFVATVNAVVAVGATPVFVDVIAPDTPHLDPADARRQMTAATRAVIVMPYGGYAMDLAPWRELGLTVIEDAAHCAGAGVPTGVHGPAAFSFLTNKDMTTAEGGMLLVPDPERRERERRLRAHGMTASTLDRDRGRAVGYDVVECGHNVRMDELRAALGLVQPVLLPAGTDRAAVMAALRAGGIQSSVHYPPAHLFTAFRGAAGADAAAAPGADDRRRGPGGRHPHVGDLRRCPTLGE